MKEKDNKQSIDGYKENTSSCYPWYEGGYDPYWYKGVLYPQDCNKTPANNIGWECPACSMIYAPHVRSCECQQPKPNITTTY